MAVCAPTELSSLTVSLGGDNRLLICRHPSCVKLLLPALSPVHHRGEGGGGRARKGGGGEGEGKRGGRGRGGEGKRGEGGRGGGGGTVSGHTGEHSVV